MKIILASSSPRRKEILLKSGYDIEVISSLYDEKINGHEYSDNLVMNCSNQKGLEVKNRIKTDKIIVSADTVVVLDNLILGKPKNRIEAYQMLSNLSNKRHFVATSISILHQDKVINDIEKTYVTFRKLYENDIYNYIDNYKPFDKAGSYGIQDENFDFAINIDGELDNVIGFPMKTFEHNLELIQKA